jgi:hypothetical protein
MQIIRSRGRWFLMLGLIALLVPSTVTADKAFIGYPYGMHYGRTGFNADVGTVYMFDQNGMYAGAATISTMTANPAFAIGSWETLREAMYNRKLTVLWHTPAGSTVNDGTTGELTAFFVTIF